MLRSTCVLLFSLLAVGLPAGCGGGERVRPAPVAVFPTGETVVEGPVREIRVVYDSPISILNPFDVRVRANGVFMRVTLSQEAAFPNSVFLRPLLGTTWPVDAEYTVELIQGAVVNAEDHYAAIPYSYPFTVAPELPVPFTQPDRVTLLDPNTFLATSSTPAPAGQEPVAAIRTAYAGEQRVWAQLDNGAGGGDALAWYAPGDANMVTIPLSSSGGDLLATRPTLLMGLDLLFVYAAYRDDSLSAVRVAKVDVRTGTEVDSLVLESVPTGPSTMPVGVAVDTLSNRLLVTAHDGATGTMASIELDSFTEFDWDEDVAGFQGVTLPAGAGPVAFSGNWAGVGPSGSMDMTRVDAGATGESWELPNGVVGTNVEMTRSQDGVLFFQPLDNYVDGLGLVRRTVLPAFADPLALEISDDVGGVSAGALGCVDMQLRAGGPNFFLLLRTAGGLVLTSWSQSGATLTQQDLDEETEGIQGVDVTSQVPGATSIGLHYGLTAPSGR